MRGFCLIGSPESQFLYMQKFEEQLLLHVLVLKMPQVERLVEDLMQITPDGGFDVNDT